MVKRARKLQNETATTVCVDKHQKQTTNTRKTKTWLFLKYFVSSSFELPTKHTHKQVPLKDVTHYLTYIMSNQNIFNDTVTLSYFNSAVEGIISDESSSGKLTTASGTFSAVPTVSLPCKKVQQSHWKSPFTSTANWMSSSFDSHRYMPVWACFADGTTRLRKVPSDCRSTPFCGSTSVPSLYQLTCPLESDSSHCRVIGEPAVTVFFWSASEKAENLTSGAKGLNVKF